jgi:drug/metabolite transporter (DMT)-like permease
VFAIFGVFLIVYGNSFASAPSEELSALSLSSANSDTWSKSLVGDALTLVAAVGYSFYQVLYKHYVALPNLSPEEPLDKEGPAYEPVDGDSESATEFPLSSSPTLSTMHLSLLQDDVEESLGLPSRTPRVQPVYPAFGLHPNFITSCLGLTTLIFLWPPIILLDYYGIEPFRPPPDATTWVAVATLCLCGVAYNAGSMVSPLVALTLHSLPRSMQTQ